MSISNNQSDTDQEDTPPSTTTPKFNIPPSESTDYRIAATPATSSDSHVVTPISPVSAPSISFTNSMSLLKTNETTTIDLMELLPKDYDKTLKIGANVTTPSRWTKSTRQSSSAQDGNMSLRGVVSDDPDNVVMEVNLQHHNCI